MIDLVKLLTDNPNAKALMTEIYNFEESLAKVGRAETLSMVIFDIFLLNFFFGSNFTFTLRSFSRAYAFFLRS